MGSNRVLKKLSELGKIVGGATPSTKHDEYFGGSIPWLSPKDLTGYRFRYIARGATNITKAGYSSCSTTLLPTGSILFSSRAPIGYIAISECPVCTNQGFKSVIPNNDTDNLFLYYLLLANKRRIESLGSGTTFKEVSASVMKGIEFNVPESKIEQQAIAKVLDKLDSKIELNYRINDYLLGLASVQFEMALKKGVQLIKFGDLVELEDSKRVPLNKQDREARIGPYPYYGATSVMDYVDDYLFDGIRVLLGEDGSVMSDDGYPVLQYVWGKYWVNNHAHIVKSKSRYSLETLFLALRRTGIAHIVTGAVQMKISQRNLNNLELHMPNPDNIPSFDSLFALYRNNADESCRLAELRDTLLPKLLSGEIDVSKVNI